jgi:type VI secretion system Hcp family effector
MPIVAGTPADCFLFIEGTNGSPVPGESKDSVHNGEVQVYSYGLGCSGGSGASGDKLWKPDFQPVTMTIGVGRASPFLAKAAWTGEVFKRMTISLRKPGATAEDGDYLQWRFGTVQVTGYTHSLAGEVPQETIEISYQSIEMFYSRQGHKGSLKDNMVRAFSLDENKTVESTLPYKPKPQSGDK